MKNDCPPPGYDLTPNPVALGSSSHHISPGGNPATNLLVSRSGFFGVLLTRFRVDRGKLFPEFLRSRSRLPIFSPFSRFPASTKRQRHDVSRRAA